MSNALRNIRGVFVSLSGGRASSSPYWVWSMSAVNLAMIALLSSDQCCVLDIESLTKLASDDEHTEP